MFSFLHAADLHLDSKLAGLENYPGMPAATIRAAARQSLVRLVELAIGERVRFVLIAGDVYDGDWQDVRTGLFFVEQMARLHAASIPVFFIAGNHDAQNRMTRELPLPENVCFFGSERPATKVLEEFRVALHGQSFAEQNEQRNLAASYPAAMAGYLNIGLLHTSLDGREGHGAYAPCQLADLQTRGYDYWALGHVHLRESVNGDSHPRVEFPGNLQGRHIRETGAKGCLLVKVDEQRRLAVEFKPLDAFRFARVEVDCRGVADLQEAFDRVAAEVRRHVDEAAGLGLAVRVELVGECSLHDELSARRRVLTDELRASLMAQAGGNVWLEKLRVVTTRPCDAARDESLGEDALSELTAVIAELRRDPAALAPLLAAGDLPQLANRLPAELSSSQEAISLQDPGWAAGLLDRVQAILAGAAGERRRIMRFFSVTYRCFGRFQETTLDVSAGQHGLHLIHGPNEAGKSTALRGLRYLLFGFPTKITEAFRHPHGQQRVGAVLSDRDGGQFACLRRRGNKNTLRDAEDKESASDERLRGLLGNLGEEQFDMLFGLDYQRLVDGGEDIARGDGNLGQALFEAGAGLAGIGRIAASLDQQLESLYKPRGQVQTIAKALADWQRQRDLLRTTTLHWESWSAKDKELRETDDRLNGLEAVRKQNRAAAARLKDYRSALPAIGVCRELQVRLLPLAEARLLDERFEEEHRRTFEELQAAKIRAESLRTRVEALAAQLQEESLDEAVLAEEAVLERLKKQLGVCQKAERDAVDINARMREHRGAARRIMKKFFAREDLEQAAELEITASEQERIRRLGGQRDAAWQGLQDATARVRQLASEGQSAARLLASTEEPAALDELAAVDDLAALVKAILQEGPLERHASQAAAQLEIDRQQAQAAWAPLAASWNVTPEEAASIPLPALETLAEFDGKFRELEGVGRQLSGRADNLDAELRGLARQIKLAARGGAVPGEADLEQARDARDVGVQIVGRQLRGEPAAAEAATFTAQHAPDAELIDALQRSVNRCDDLVDLMRRDAGRTAELSLHQAELEKTEQERQALATAVAAHERETVALGERWQNLWRPFGMDPKSPDAMRAWLLKVQSALGRFGDLQAAEQRLQSQRICIADWRNRLCAALQLAPRERSLAETIELAQQRLQAAAEQRKVRDDLAAGLESLRRQQQREEGTLREADQRWKNWQADWSAAVGTIGLSSQDDPATAGRYLDQLAEMFRELREAGTIELRLKGMERDGAAFLAELAALRRRLAGDDAPPSTFAGMQADLDALDRRWKEAVRLRTQQEQLQRDWEAATKQHAAEADLCVKLQARMQALCEQAGVARDAEIPQALQRSQERREAKERLVAEQSRLHELARGKPLEEFAASALAERETLDEQLATLAEREEPLDEEIKSLAVAAERTKRQLQDWRNADEAAADARQQLESIATGLRENVEEYAALHLARQVLKLAVERFRQKHQDSLLARAGHYFAMLTNGSFGGLEVEEGDRGPVLLAARESPREQVTVEHLSDGTRDQLFLALRLAGIERHLETSEPMPLIVDDLLVNFDDARAVATLQCLAELSRRTQVLLFTHHDHLVALAKANLPEGVVFCHDLAAAESGSPVDVERPPRKQAAANGEIKVESPVVRS